MKVKNMTGNSYRAIPNQFEIEDDNGNLYFQSYDSVIVKIVAIPGRLPQVYLDERNWDYSRTTGKYRNMFLGESMKETQRKIDSGEYILTDLNKKS